MGRQAKPIITGKQPWACEDRPPGVQAGGLLTREGPEFQHWVQKAFRMEEGWLYNCDARVTEKVTLLHSTAWFLPTQKDMKI